MNLFVVTLTAEGGLRIEAAWCLIVIMFVAIGGIIFVRRQQLFGKASYLEVNEAEIGIGSGKVKLKANLDDLQIGFKFWTELTTRKIGLPLDEEHDVIVEVYNSWYEFFGIAREMIKSIPVSKIRASQTTKELVLISVHILNKELRPHLTRWQARYRRWWDSVVDDAAHKDVPPQQLQQMYPHYEELIAEMKAVNAKLVIYANHLKKMIEI